MAFDVKVAGASVSGITVTGGRVELQEWPGILAKEIAVALPDLVAPTWPTLTSAVVPRQFAVGLLLIGASPASFNSLWDAVAAVVQTTGTVALTRTRDLNSGTETKTASGVYLGGLEPTMESGAAGRCMPRWQLLGEWA